MKKREILVFSGESSDMLASIVCTLIRSDLNVRHASCQRRGWFNEQAPIVQLQHVRDAACVVFIQSLMPMASAFVQLCAMIDAAVRASARRIIVVMPYFPGRQDKKDDPWVDITPAWVLPALESLGGDRLERFISFDLHSGQIQGYARKPFDHLTALPSLVSALVKRCEEIKLTDATLVSPDAGGLKRVRNLSRMCHTKNIVIIDKERSAPGENQVRAVIGDPGEINVIVDDIGDTVGTVVEAAKAIKLKNKNARVYALFSHAVLGGTEKYTKALENVSHPAVDQFVVSNTIPVSHPFIRTGKVTVVSVAPVLAKALERILTGGSINEMFAEMGKEFDS